MNPAVSVVVPLYQGARYIREALASIAAQSFRDFDVVVVDDGSSDEGPALVEATPGVRLLRRPHGGVAAARNAGILASAGELLAFLDQDDRWVPGKLAVQVARLRACPALDLLHARQRMFLDDGFARPGWVRAQDLDQPRPGKLPGTLVARRSAFTRIGLYDETYATTSDVDWYARAVAAGLGHEMLPDCLVERRVHAGNQSRMVDLSSADLLRTMRTHLRRQRG